MPDAPANSNLRSDKDNQLISLSKQYNKAFADKDVVLSKLEAILSESVVYHADKVTLQDSIKGRSNVISYIENYFDKWDFERVETFGAVNDKDNIAFSVGVDKGVVPKTGVHPEQVEKGQVKPSNVINITALIFDSHDQITDIYPARQLSHDEAHRKLKSVPDYHGTSFNPEWLTDDKPFEPSEERVKLHQEYASLWNKMFCDNDISKAEKICDPNIKVHQLLVSQQTDGLDAWKESLAGIFKDWECKGNKNHIAVTAGNKAFIFWETTGVTKGQETTVWGISVLLFNEDKIKEAASIYQPFPGMREALVKAA